MLFLLRAIILTFLIFQGFDVVYAEEPHGITVTVENGTTSAPVSKSLPVTLHIVEMGAELDTFTLNTTGNSEVFFPDVKINPDLSYFVSTEYQEALYFEPVYKENEISPIKLHVYESTPSMENIRVKDDTVLISDDMPAPQTLHIFEIIRIENTGKTTFIPDLTKAKDGVMSFLRFSLPESAFNLDVQTNLLSGNYLQVDKGFALISPVPPGEHRIMLRYQAPYNDNSFVLSPSFPFGLDSYSITMPKNIGSIQSNEMTILPDEEEGAISYHVLEARELMPGSSLKITLTSLPTKSLFDRFTQKNALFVFLPIIFGVILLSILIYSYRQPRSALHNKTKKNTSDSSEDIFIKDHAKELESIANLDDEYEKGNISKEKYEVIRQQMKYSLINRNIKSVPKGSSNKD